MTHVALDSNSSRAASFQQLSLPYSTRQFPVDAGSIPPLRVALFSGNYNYVRDGANQSLNRLVAHLESHRIPVRVYSPTVEEPAFPPAGELISVPSIAIPRRPEYRLGLGLSPKLIADIKNFQPTLFHVSSPDLIGSAAVRLAQKWGRPIVASYHTRFETYLKYYRLGFLEPLIVRYLRNFYRRCDQVYAPSECMAGILSDLGFNEDIRIWSRGIDLGRFHPAKRDPAWRAALGIQPGEVVVAFLGRLVLEKGLDLFADVMNRLATVGTRCRVLVVGEGPERAMLQEKLPQAIFTGLLEGEPLARAYASSDIFFNPSTTETFGNVTLEAMASGVATVCAAATGSRSLVTNGKTGLLVTPGNREEFAATLTHLICQVGMRESMGRAGREASTRYDWDHILNELITHYHDAVSCNATPSTASPRLAQKRKPALQLVRG